MADIVSLIVVYGSVAGLCIAVFLITLKKIGKKKTFTLKDLKMKSLGENTYKDMTDKVEQHGKKMPFFKSGKLWIGLNEICHVDRWLTTKGKLESPEFDYKKKEIFFKNAEKDAVDYDFLILRTRNKKIILRWLGLKKSYYIFNAKSKKDKKPTYYHDTKDRRFIFKEHTDMQSYGNVWICSNEAEEYIDNLSIKRMLEQIMMLVEYIPDKATHLEIDNAQKERLARVFTDLEKSKYDDSKKADQTVVS